MASKSGDHAQGLAEQSVNTSIVHPSQDDSNRRPRDRRSASNRGPYGNDQREGLEKAEPGRPGAEDHMKP